MNSVCQLFPFLSFGGCKGIPSGKITKIISIGESYQCNLNSSIKQYYFDCQDDGTTDLISLFDPICSLIEETRLQSENIYVHCAYGQSRSPTFII